MQGLVVGYVRVSSSGQSYESQRTEIERAAVARGERIERWYADVASGARLDRPELSRLRRDVAAGRVRTVWVWALDRLGRSGIVDTLCLLKEFRGAGCELRSLTDAFPLDGPFAEPAIALLAWCAQQERERIRERREAGIARMRLEGRSAGRPPSIGEDTRGVIRQLGASGLSVRKIARRVKVSRSSVWNILHPAGTTGSNN